MFDAEITLHVHEATWASARATVMAVAALLQAEGYTITVGPTLPYEPLSTPEQMAEFWEGTDDERR